MGATVNAVFKRVFTLIGEDSQTVSCNILDDNNVVVANKQLTKMFSGGYLFSHVFPMEGLFIIEVSDSKNKKFRASVIVSKHFLDEILL